MATLVDTGYEAATVAGNFDSVADTESRFVMDSSVKFRGSQSFHDPGSAGAVTSRGIHNVSAALKTFSWRVAYRYHAAPAANCIIIGLRNGTKSCAIRHNTTGKLAALSGSGNSAGATTLAIDTWYIIQGTFDITTDPPVVTFRLYDSSGVAIDPLVSYSGNAGAIASADGFYVGDFSLSASLSAWWDSLKVTDSLADYPLGMPAADPVTGITKFGTRHGVVQDPCTSLWLPTD